MKNILISMQPQWVEKILNGEKTIEIRKTMPKCKLPCKVYIYCTKNEKQYLSNVKCCESLLMDSNSLGKVVAKFMLYDIETIERDFNDWLPKRMYDIMPSQLEASCLTEKELCDYGNGKVLYAWYIDDLKIYDKPKELSEFGQECLQASEIHCRDCIHNKNWDDCCSVMIKPLKTPPQSWCYVEENL